MSGPDALIQAKVAEMRQRFDEAFTTPPREEAAPLEPLLAITAGSEQLAIRMRQISGVDVIHGKIVSVPSTVPELIGITTFRGAVAPLFSLSRLLNLSGQGEDVRWIMRAGEGPDAMALGFGSFDGYIEVGPADIFPGTDPAERPYVRETTRHNGVLRGIVDVISLAEQVRNLGSATPPR